MASCQTALLIGNDDSSLRGLATLAAGIHHGWPGGASQRDDRAATRAHGKTFRERADGWTLGIKHFQFGNLEAAQREHQSPAREQMNSI